MVTGQPSDTDITVPTNKNTPLVKPLEYLFNPISPRLSRCQATKFNLDAPCYLTGQPMSSCQCGQCKEWRIDMSGDNANFKTSSRNQERKGSVFISHKQGADNDIALYLHEELTQLGYEVYLDIRMAIGTDFTKLLPEKLNAADYFIALLSNESQESDWVQTEGKHASERNKQDGRPQIIPVRIGREMRYTLITKAVFGRFTPAEWDGSEYSKGVLLNQVRGALKPIPQPPKAGGLPLGDNTHLSRNQRRLVGVVSVLVVLLAAGFLFYLYRQSPNQVSSQATQATIQVETPAPQSQANANSLQHNSNSDTTLPRPERKPSIIKLPPSRQEIESWVRTVYTKGERIDNIQYADSANCTGYECRLRVTVILKDTTEKPGSETVTVTCKLTNGVWKLEKVVRN